MLVHSCSNERRVVNLSITIPIYAQESLLQLLNLLVGELKSLLQCSFRFWGFVVDLAVLILVQENELLRHTLQLVRLDLHRGYVRAYCSLELSHLTEFI